MIIPLERVLGEAVAARYRPRHSGSRLRQPEQRTAVWAPPGSHPTAALLGEVVSGAPPPASTPETADQPEQHSCRAAAALWQQNLDHRLPVRPPPSRRRTQTPDWWTLSRRPARRSDAGLNTRCSSSVPRAPLVSVSVSSRVDDQRLRPGPEQMARRKRSTCVQDRRRFSEALGLGDNSHGIGWPLSTGCRSTGLASVLC